LSISIPRQRLRGISILQPSDLSTEPRQLATADHGDLARRLGFTSSMCWRHAPWANWQAHICTCEHIMRIHTLCLLMDALTMHRHAARLSRAVCISDRKVAPLNITCSPSFNKHSAELSSSAMRLLAAASHLVRHSTWPHGYVITPALFALSFLMSWAHA